MKRKLDRLLTDVNLDSPRPQRMSIAELDAIESGRVKYGEWMRDNGADAQVVSHQLAATHPNSAGGGETQRDRVIQCASWARQHYTQEELAAIAARGDEAIQALYDQWLEAMS